MENTLENKAKFFAQYWGQKLLAVTVNENDFRQKIGNTYMGKYHVEMCHVELKDIDNITDEHAVMLGFENASDFFIDGSTYAMIDDLRLLGYAVDWSDLSVDEMIDFGWIKLKSE